MKAEKEKRAKKTQDNIKNITVATKGETLLDYVSKILTDFKKTKVKSMLKHNQFAVNSTPTTLYNQELKVGDRVSINFDKSFKVFSHPRIKLVYEDDSIIVINKGYGVLSMGTDKIKDGTAYSIVREYIKYSNPMAKLFIVHRLDRDTSGLMMFAKSVEAKEKMQHNWNNMVISRTYVALVEGSVETDEGTIRSYLAENSRFEVYSTENKEEGQLAITRYKVLRRDGGYTLMDVELDTGRKNQIRVHMKDLGHPIVGDRKYGASSSPIHRLALHARTLRFVHPIEMKDMNFEIPVPAKFKVLLNRRED
ncbi:MAG: RluA family pseudouridine synthase [Bacteroidales bacterium]